MSNELNGYTIKKVERLVKGLYIVICQSRITGVNSARLVSIPLENEVDAIKRSDCTEVFGMICSAALRSIPLNWDESPKCDTFEVQFTDEECEKLDAWCKELEISDYAFFRAVNLFLCDPANEKCILRLLETAVTEDGAKAIRVNLEK